MSTGHDTKRAPAFGVVEVTTLKAPATNRLKKYGITRDDWYAQLEAQGIKCALCSKAFTRLRYPCVDHNHRTGEWRGLLCSPCNEKLGADHEDREWYWNAYHYLGEPPTRDIFLQPRIAVNAPPASRTRRPRTGYDFDGFTRID